MTKYLTAIISCLWASGATAQSCMEIKFAPGASSGEIAAYVIENEPKCFIFGTGAGQTARLQLFGSNNACFTIKDVIDCQDDYSFRTQRRNYEVGVFQLFPKRSYEEVTLRLTIR